jgi:hypothetical protein
MDLALGVLEDAPPREIEYRVHETKETDAVESFLNECIGKDSETKKTLIQEIRNEEPAAIVVVEKKKTRKRRAVARNKAIFELEQSVKKKE